VVNEHAEFAPGWLHAMRITVAHDELRSGWTEGVAERQVVEVPADTGFDAVSIDVLLGAVGAGPIRIERALPVAELARGDRGIVIVIARLTNLDAPVRIALAHLIPEAVDGVRARGWDGSTAIRFVIFGGGADGYLQQIEIALDPD
jgi:hypothetical protein